jgi:diguanylate cyclase
MAEDGDFERTRVPAQSALERLKAYDQAATPQNYEFWYNYCAGFNAPLNAAVNEILAISGTISQPKVDELFLKFVSAARIGEKIDQFGMQMVDEIEQVMSMIDSAIGSASSYSASLEGATQKISNEADREQIRSIVEVLVRATREVETANMGLQQRLTDSRQEIRQLQENLEVVRTESLTDPLTTLANRKYFDDSFQRLMREAETKDFPLSLILADIDHFKKFNDTFGHLIGDQVLRLVGVALKHTVKGQDVAARFGGEEFAVLLPRTPLAAAVTVAEHVRAAVHAKELMRRSTGETLGRVTVSLGVAAWRRGDTTASLIQRADTCLYQAKGAGRNCVVPETRLAGAGNAAKVA